MNTRTKILSVVVALAVIVGGVTYTATNTQLFKGELAIGPVAEAPVLDQVAPADLAAPPPEEEARVPVRPAPEEELAEPVLEVAPELQPGALLEPADVMEPEDADLAVPVLDLAQPIDLTQPVLEPSEPQDLTELRVEDVSPFQTLTVAPLDFPKDPEPGFFPPDAEIIPVAPVLRIEPAGIRGPIYPWDEVVPPEGTYSEYELGRYFITADQDLKIPTYAFFYGKNFSTDNLTSNYFENLRVCVAVEECKDLTAVMSVGPKDPLTVALMGTPIESKKADFESAGHFVDVPVYLQVTQYTTTTNTGENVWTREVFDHGTTVVDMTTSVFTEDPGDPVIPEEPADDTPPEEPVIPDEPADDTPTDGGDTFITIYEGDTFIYNDTYFETPLDPGFEDTLADPDADCITEFVDLGATSIHEEHAIRCLNFTNIIHGRFDDPILGAHFVPFDVSGETDEAAASGNTLRSEILKMILRIMGFTAESADGLSEPFLDVGVGNWWWPYAAQGLQTGILTEAEYFYGESEVSRADTVVMAYRAAGSPSVEGLTEDFLDVVESAYYYAAALWAANQTVTTATETNVPLIQGTAPGIFDPLAPMQRAHMAVFITRLTQVEDFPIGSLEPPSFI